MRRARRFEANLTTVTDELTASDGKTIQFRLKRAFALLPDALAKAPSNFAATMPERLAKTAPYSRVTEVVGSGPFKFVAKEHSADHIVV